MTLPFDDEDTAYMDVGFDDEYEDTLEDDYDYEGVADRHAEIMERLDRIEEMIESLKGK